MCDKSSLIPTRSVLQKTLFSRNLQLDSQRHKPLTHLDLLPAVGPGVPPAAQERVRRLRDALRVVRTRALDLRARESELQREVDQLLARRDELAADEQETVLRRRDRAVVRRRRENDVSMATVGHFR